MKRSRRVEITVETEVSVAVRGGAASGAAEPCVRCGAAMVSPSIAARMASTSVREIYRRIESGAMHYAEHGGEGLVCFSNRK